MYEKIKTPTSPTMLESIRATDIRRSLFIKLLENVKSTINLLTHLSAVPVPVCAGYCGFTRGGLIVV